MMTVLFNGRVSMIAAMILAVVIGQQPVLHDVPATFLCVVGGVTAALSPGRSVSAAAPTIHSRRLR